MLSIKSSEVPPAPRHGCAASPVPLPSLPMLSSGLKLQPHTRGVRCSLSGNRLALAGCSRSPQPREGWAGPFPSPWMLGKKWRAG